MENSAITRRDARVKLFIDILSEKTWNIPTDFAVSIQTDEYMLNDKEIAVAHLRLFPNIPEFITESAALEVLTCAKALSLHTTFESRHGSPCIQVGIYLSIKRQSK